MRYEGAGTGNMTKRGGRDGSGALQQRGRKRGGSSESESEGVRMYGCTDLLFGWRPIEGPEPALSILVFRSSAEGHRRDLLGTP